MFHLDTLNEFAREPLDPKAVVADLRVTVEYFSQEKLWHWWVLQPNEKFVRNLRAQDDAYEDFGNENWEALVNLMNLSSVVPSVYGQEIFNPASYAVHEDSVNKAGKGTCDFRGNGVGRMLTCLLFRSQEERLAVLS